MKRIWLAALLAAIHFCTLAGIAGAGEEAAPLAADLVSDGQLIDIHSERYEGLFKELRISHDFTQAQLVELFGGVAIKKRVLELMDTQWEAKPYYEYFPRFITTQVIREGQWMLEKHRELLDRVEERFGVERQIVVAIWGIESRFGKNDGAFGMFQTLNTLFDAYPRRRGFYRKQLIDFLVLCRDNGVDPLSITGSYGGAFGQTQFIPSSFVQYAVDFDGDGKRDVWNSTPDVLASIANYLRKFGWKMKDPVYVDIGSELRSQELFAAYKQGRKGFVGRGVIEAAQSMRLPAVEKDGRLTVVGLETDNRGGMRFVAGYPNFQAITAWNNSNRYAMAVTELAERFIGKGPVAD
ncbi:MAG: lytic murein transglycosylase [Thermodesulfobacteriota bacterium]